MLKHLTLAAILLTATAPLAYAQDSSDDGDRYESSDRGDADRGDKDDGPRSQMRDHDDDRDGDHRMRDMRHGDRWARNSDDDRMEPRKMGRGDRPGPRGMGGRRGPPPPPRAGFEIHTAPGQFLRFECGEEGIADCVEAAQPILDMMAKMPGATDTAAPAGDALPPPPSSLVDTPPASSPTPPPPPSDDTPGADAPSPSTN